MSNRSNTEVINEIERLRTYDNNFDCPFCEVKNLGSNYNLSVHLEDECTGVTRRDKEIEE